MALMKRITAVTIACKTMNPFLSCDLLQRKDGKVVPITGAREVRIGDALLELAKQDKRFGLHVIDDIVRSLFELSKKSGFKVRISAGALKKGKVKTIGKLADELEATATEI